MLSITSHVGMSRGLPAGWGRTIIDPQGLSVETDLPDLLANFRDLCTRGGIDISQIEDTTIWKSTWVPKVDKPRFSDLYWKMILGKVVAGDFWLKEKSDCPVCNTTQLAEHLFWDCPVAQRMWSRLRQIWVTITGSSISIFPTSWPQLLLTGVTTRKKTWGDQVDQRRFRILFGESIWAIWIQKCRWSHDDLKYDYPAILSLFREAMLLRVGRERIYARSASSGGQKETFRQTWGFDADAPSLPDWLL